MTVTFNDKKIELPDDAHGIDVRCKLLPEQNGYEIYRVFSGQAAGENIVGDEVLLDSMKVNEGDFIYSIPPVRLPAPLD